MLLVCSYGLTMPELSPTPELSRSSLFQEKFGDSGGKRKLLLLSIVFAFILVFGVIAGAFFYRLPVLIVTDYSFMAVYGSGRLREIESRLSRKLFRRLIPVYIDENAGPDIVSFAVEDTFQTPFAVFFPHRYTGGAGYYKENHPNIPVYVVSGRNQSSIAKEAVFFVRTDVKTDLYRAGLCAALLAGEESVILISNVTVPDENREAFAEGLRAQGYTGTPVYRNPSYNFSSGGDIGCAVIMGQAGEFFVKRPTTPVILFSWTDPGIVTRSVKVIFDDSPYALAYKGYSLIFSIYEEYEKNVKGDGEKADQAGEVLISSVPTVFKNRIDKKEDSIMLENLVKREFQN
jgi:hypothetical protein